MARKFYRISNTETEQGLWYNFEGDFTGLIHGPFSFCKVSMQAMDFDPELVGWLSACETLEELYAWFDQEEILELQKHGYFIHVYETDTVKFYEKFQHTVISQQHSTLINKIILDENKPTPTDGFLQAGALQDVPRGDDETLLKFNSTEESF